MAPTPPGDGTVNILVVAGNRIFADVLAMRQREEPQVGAVAVAGSAQEARAAALAIRPAVLLIEGDGRDDSRLQLIAELPEPDVWPVVLMLSRMSAWRVRNHASRSASKRGTSSTGIGSR